MELFESDFLELIKAFNESEIRYIVVGGLCINFHGYKRNTGDIDLWIEDTLENRIKIVDTFESLGFGRFEALIDLPMIPGFCEILLDNGIYVDLMDRIHGYDKVGFVECYKNKVMGSYDNVSVPFLHINQLLHSKKQSQRAKDKLDVIALTKLVSEQA